MILISISGKGTEGDKNSTPGCLRAQCDWEPLGSYPLPGLSPNACPEMMMLNYPFLDNLVPHIRQPVVERLEKICPVLPPNGSFSIKVILQHRLDIVQSLGPFVHNPSAMRINKRE